MTPAEQIRQLEQEIATIRFTASQMIEARLLLLIQAKDKLRTKRKK